MDRNQVTFPMNKNLTAAFAILLVTYTAVVFYLYGASLNFGFVYDDHTRIVHNPGIKSVSNPARFFTDPTTQAGSPQLHRDNYRPLTTLNFALDHALWGLRARPYHFENLILHVLTGLLVAMVAFITLKISFLGSFLAGLLFLCHPVQTESVAWIAGRSNLSSLLFVLSALLAWNHYQKTLSRVSLAIVYVCFLAGIFIRETAVVLPFLLLMFDVAMRSKRRWIHYGLMMAGTVGLMIVRKITLEQVAQSPHWGGTFISNLANVFSVWPLYIQKILWPVQLRATYSDLPIETSFAAFRPVFGFVLFLAFSFLTFHLLKSGRRRLFFIFGIFLLFWLPGSNLIPLMTLFAERLLYPMMAPASLAAGIGLAALVHHVKKIRFSALLSIGFFFCIFSALFSLTKQQVAVWESDETLWANATRVNPDAWFGWYSLGLVELNKANRFSKEGNVEQAREWADRASETFISALKQKPPLDSGALLFLYLAKANRIQGNAAFEEKHLQRAFELNPNLENLWTRLASS